MSTTCRDVETRIHGGRARGGDAPTQTTWCVRHASTRCALKHRGSVGSSASRVAPLFKEREQLSVQRRCCALSSTTAPDASNRVWHAVRILAKHPELNQVASQFEVAAKPFSLWPSRTDIPSQKAAYLASHQEVADQFVLRARRESWPRPFSTRRWPKPDARSNVPTETSLQVFLRVARRPLLMLLLILGLAMTWTPAMQGNTLAQDLI